MTPKKPKFAEILDGIDFVSSDQVSEHQAYLCKKTGQVHLASENLDEPLPADIEDEEKYIALPHKRDLGLGKPLALEFARACLPESVGRVNGFFARPGGYARFKSLLERQDKLKQWYDYERIAMESAVWEWCKERGIEIDGVEAKPWSP